VFALGLSLQDVSVSEECLLLSSVIYLLLLRRINPVAHLQLHLKSGNPKSFQTSKLEVVALYSGVEAVSAAAVLHGTMKHNGLYKWEGSRLLFVF